MIRLSLIFILLIAAHAQATELDDKKARYNLLYSETTTPFKDLTSNSAYTAPLFFNGNYQLNYQLLNKTNEPQWVLNIGDLSLDQVDIVLISPTHSQTINASLNNKKSNVFVNSTGRGIRLELEPNIDYQLQIKLNSKIFEWEQHINIMSLDYYYQWSKRITLFTLLCFGMVVGIIIYNGALYFSTLDRAYLWFSLASTTWLLIYFSYTGIDVDITGKKITNHAFTIGLYLLATIFNLLFVYRFFSIQNWSRIAKYSYLSFTVLAVLILLTSPLFHFLLYTNLVYGISSLSMVVIVVLALYQTFRKNWPAIFVAIGWGIPFYIQINWTLALEQQINSRDFTYSVLEDNIVMVINLLCHSTAMVFRINQLRKDKLSAQNESQLKSKFMAETSHDLRQPLQAMGLIINQLQSQKNINDKSHLINQLDEGLTNFTHQFSSLLDTARLESGSVNVQATEFPLEPLLQNLCLEFSSQANIKGLTIKACHTSLWLNTDQSLLQRLLRNLISNAIRYSHSGKILLGVRRKKESCVIQVIDQGKGISKLDSEQIFKPYTQLNNADKQGVGLGLSICQQLAQLLNSRIDVQSLEGKGSCFGLTMNSIKNPNQQQSPSIAIVGKQNSKNMVNSLTSWGYQLNYYSTISEFKLNEATNEKLIIWVGVNEEQVLKFRTDFNHTQPVLMVNEQNSAKNIKLNKNNSIAQVSEAINPAQLRAYLLHLNINQ